MGASWGEGGQGVRSWEARTLLTRSDSTKDVGILRSVGLWVGGLRGSSGGGVSLWLCSPSRAECVSRVECAEPPKRRMAARHKLSCEVCCELCGLEWLRLDSWCEDADCFLSRPITPLRKATHRLTSL